ncbi:hypothetical protein GOP47_0000059 [Adiantum capillus-veneris]|uniref:PRONE domain-containing protein n=1 Tax=Adiantum capillus-veneris TaxID=13818 RepID=A0A9D4ZSR1_ADICA|nr:hypothetical protein GOP47_0000059 [Adiantum capillus-veneris]
MECKSEKDILLMPLLDTKGHHDPSDDQADHRSLGASSTASFDGFSSDTLGDGSVPGSPHRSTQWDGDESNPSISIYSSPLPWLDSSREIPGALTDEFIANLVSKKRTPEWEDNSAVDSGDKEAASNFQEADMIKERFAKLLLGEDLSGGGKGVSTALAVSNAITNLSASVFGELWQLEPLSKERKLHWHREMERLLSVSDYIVEFVPSAKSLPDGTKMRVMDTRPRLDLRICLPALLKLDAMLIEALDSFGITEFWYIDQALERLENDGSLLQRQEERWWLPSPKVPMGGLSSGTRKHMRRQRESISQILKAALAVNAQVLSEMKVPSTYMESLPKNGRSSLGEALYRVICSENFSPNAVVASIDPAQEHHLVDLVNSVEAALHIWKRKLQAKQVQIELREGLQVSVALRGFAKDGSFRLEKRKMLVGRAESLLLLVRLKFPGLPQSILDVHKIQYSKDVGQSILESYSRVLESLAYNIRSRIDDVLLADDMTRSSQPSASLSSPCVSGLNSIASTSPFHACGVPSPGRLLQSKALNGLIGKANSMEATQDGELLNNSISWLGSYKHWPYSDKVHLLQRSPSGH